MHQFFISIFLLFNILIYSLAQVPDRFDTSCGYLSQKIYCFGGSTGSDVDSVLDSNLMYLDIVYGSGNSTKELATRWTTIAANTNGVNIQSRRNPQSMVLPEGKTMLLSGGWNSDKSGLVSQTIAYSADNNSWSAYPSYTEPPFGVRQIYYASSVYIPEYGVGFYGGYEIRINQSWTYNGQNMSQYDRNGSLRYIGYTSLTFFDIKKNVDPWFVFPTQNNLPEVFPRSQTSVFDTLSNRIFFFGGKYRNSSAGESFHYSFENSVTFNVISGAWDSQILGGFPPSGRIGHTTTLLLSTNRDVLLYGGENSLNDDKPSLDYLFTLNLDSYKWVQQGIPNSEELDLTRSRHSAVPVYNDTLFIVFGRGVSGIAISSMVILNVTVPSNISYLSAYVDPNGVARPISSPGLSTGATAGIAIGAIAGGFILITALFCVWKKSKDNKKKKELEEMKRQNERIETPEIEVNWEAIDRKFATNPNINLAFTPRLVDDEATVADSRSEPYTHPVVIPNALISQRPNAIENNANITLPAHPIILQKPDGSL
ncbi:hypothetical protein EDC94DRAFT_620243 [Helicostylum pulchrum]|nr:hypothetical protein EDC94DRAFT_620243 [Helicostylum pulchrum]